MRNVRVVGHRPPAEARRYLAAADVAVIPLSGATIIAREHTSPLKMFEYMAAGVPIVASDLPSLREVLRHEHNALLVPPDDNAALAAAIERLLGDHELAARLARTARNEGSGLHMESTRGQDRGLPRPAAASLTRAAALIGRAAERLEHTGANRHRLLVTVGLLAPLLILYRGVLLAGEPWLDFDVLLSYQPRYRLLAAGVAEGRIPLWTDGILGGFPVAFSEFGWFYPLTWGLLRVFDPVRAYFIETSLGLVLAAAAAYGLGRVWGLSRRSAFLAAFLYAYSPFVFATSRFLNYADIFFVLPAGLAAIERIAQGRRHWVVGLAVITGITGLAGHPQIALLFASVWLVYALFRLAWTWRDSGRSPARCLGAWLIAALGVGLALGAVRFLPTLQTTALSGRAGGLEFATAAQGSIPPWSLVLGYLYPSFEIPRVLDETLNAEELLYLGILTPVLALMALVAAGRHRVVRFLAVLVVVAWVLAMGSYSLGFPLLHKLPLFGFFRQPARFGLVATFGLSFLAAFGFELLPRP